MKHKDNDDDLIKHWDWWNETLLNGNQHFEESGFEECHAKGPTNEIRFSWKPSKNGTYCMPTLSKMINNRNVTTHRRVYLSDSSPTERCAAKHAIAHMRIWMPWYNCLPRMSHTPWFGITWALVCTMSHVQNMKYSDMSNHQSQQSLDQINCCHTLSQLAAASSNNNNNSSWHRLSN